MLTEYGDSHPRASDTLTSTGVGLGLRPLLRCPDLRHLIVRNVDREFESIPFRRKAKTPKDSGVAQIEFERIDDRVVKCHDK